MDNLWQIKYPNRSLFSKLILYIFFQMKRFELAIEITSGYRDTISMSDAHFKKGKKVSTN